MKLETLNKIYYKSPNKFTETYEKRYNAHNTKHFPITIQQYNRRTSYPLFFYITEEIATLIETIFVQDNTLDRYISTLPTQVVTQFLKYSMISEILATNKIEGVHSTRKQINDAYKRLMESKGNTRFWSVINKYHSILQGNFMDLKTPEDIRKTYDEFLLDEIIKLDPKNAPDGKIFRTTGVEIGEPKIIHEGLMPEDNIISTIVHALEILNDQTLPLLVRIPIFHYLFGYIHPFYDGNGRTSRLITSSYISRILSPLVALRISVTIKKKRARYYELFNNTTSENNRGDVTPFVTESLYLILDTIADIDSQIKKKMLSFEKFQTTLHNKLKSMNITDDVTVKIYDILLQSILFNNDGCTIDEIAKLTGKSRNTVLARLKDIPDSQVIKDTTYRQHTYRLNATFLKD